MKIVYVDITKVGYFVGPFDPGNLTFTAIVKVMGKVGSNFRGGPAPGDRLYYKNGKLHREDGPAHYGTDGWCMYYLDSERLTFEQYWRRQKDTEYAPKIMAYHLAGK
jgi:hypothetical protein